MLSSANRIIESTVAEVEVCFTSNFEDASDPQRVASLQGAASLQRIASLCGVTNPKSVAESQNQTAPIEVPALPVELRSSCSQPAAKL